VIITSLFRYIIFSPYPAKAQVKKKGSGRGVPENAWGGRAKDGSPIFIPTGSSSVIRARRIMREEPWGMGSFGELTKTTNEPYG
jgi:hypothetical protein